MKFFSPKNLPFLDIAMTNLLWTVREALEQARAALPDALFARPKVLIPF